MSMTDRAAQFSPFAALVGHGAAIRETARLTDRRIALTEDEKAILDDKLCLLLDTGGEAVLTSFLPDEKKNGGAYVTAAGSIKKLDLLERKVVLTGDAVIPVEDILEIESPHKKYNQCEGYYEPERDQ